MCQAFGQSFVQLKVLYVFFFDLFRNMHVICALNTNIVSAHGYLLNQAIHESSRALLDSFEHFLKAIISFKSICYCFG